VELQPEANIAAGPFLHGLGQLLREAGCEVDAVRADAGSASAIPANGSRRTVLVLRDAHRHNWQRAAADVLLAVSGDAVVVETGLPLWRPSGGGGYLATLGAGRVNLEAAVELLRGRRAATSSAPARPAGC
jgi:beta-N-acetylhexosaminidase